MVELQKYNSFVAYLLSDNLQTKKDACWVITSSPHASHFSKPHLLSQFNVGTRHRCKSVSMHS